jgi:NAD(P)-dependent dehydrogenase (short-subunit alcohol dehydrogenase family)
LDILVNNAGIAPDQWVSGFDLEIDLLREIMEVNLYSGLRLTQLFMPMMKTSGYGRIVNMSSELATLSQCQMGSTIGYRMSKAAMNSMTVLLAQELKEFPDILINAAAPGWVNTELGGPDAPRKPEEGADTPVWLATLPEGGPSGGFYREREVYPW